MPETSPNILSFSRCQHFTAPFTASLTNILGGLEGVGHLTHDLGDVLALVDVSVVVLGHGGHLQHLLPDLPTLPRAGRPFILPQGFTSLQTEMALAHISYINISFKAKYLITPPTH